jgi:RNA polymerase sigma factor, sigma-70 family
MLTADAPDPPDDRRLLAAFRGGDRAAFDALFARYAPRVLAFALHLTGGSRAEAEDLTQETFVAAFRGASAFRGGSRLLTWLLGIAVRRHRDAGRRTCPPTATLTDGDADSRPAVADVATDAVAFRDALATLDSPLRDAFLLVAAQGLTHREAAEVLGAPLGTVKWRVAEATKRLRAALTVDAAFRAPEPLAKRETEETNRHVSPVQQHP